MGEAKNALQEVVDAVLFGVKRLESLWRAQIAAISREERQSARDLVATDRSDLRPGTAASAKDVAVSRLREDGGMSFAAAVGGPDPKLIDATLVNLADDVGKVTSQCMDLGGFTQLGPADLAAVGIPFYLGRDSGLRFKLYRNSSGHTVLAFAGTDGLSWKSWRANLTQGMGLETLQYVEAGRIAKMAKLAYGDELVVTGHSLGGGLASFAALKSGAPAVTFNAAGLTDQTIVRLSLDPAAARTHAAAHSRNYAFKTDPLTGLQHSRLGLRVSVAAAVGGVVGSSVGAVVGAAATWSIGHIAGTIPARGFGSMIGAGVAGSAAAAVFGGGFAQVRPAIGQQIMLLDPVPPADSNFWVRVNHALDTHRIEAVRSALLRSRLWDG